MADRDRDRSIQAQIHPQHRFDQVVRGGNYYQSGGGPSTSKVLAALTLLPVGGTLLALAGLTLTGTVIGLTVATPLFVIFSPVLVPAALTITMAVFGFLSSGALGVIGLSSLSYVFKRLRPGTGGEQVDMDWAKRGMQDLVGYAGQKTKEAGQKTKEVGQNIENNYKSHDQGVRA
ncbi:Oleosin 18.2 kDa [Hibiscus syriacus]|uniref:Oleosin n=1 Tax=Hibiscus syriacus TaxID=106335 RepID=A0A6A3ATP4_HIBSY|nr:oleosin 16.4 kDa-like [Hibiscus syriacus]KAE8706262.1 Oleosin 18.2 kDa [Hibiscus syriacus]